MIKYNRVLLKLSGECLLEKGDKRGVDVKTALSLAEKIIDASTLGCEIAVVIGGGNIIRGADVAEATNVDRTTTDLMGMLATSINALAVRASLEKLGAKTAMMSAFPIGSYVEEFSAEKAKKYLGEKKILLLSGGTGRPYFSTDTGASLRALEINADALLKGTKVDGVYDSDPMKNKNAKRFEELSYSEIVEKKLKVMDLTAVTLCQEKNLPIIVFDAFKDGNLKRVLGGERIGTVIYGRTN